MQRIRRTATLVTGLFLTLAALLAAALTGVVVKTRHRTTLAHLPS
jgi:hypothetical protein